MKIYLPNRRLYIFSGLTLIEFLVVMAILMVLFLLAFIVYPTQIAKARDAKRKDQLFRYRFALEDYFDDNACYPMEAPACGASLAGPLGSPVYLSPIPCDPETGEVYAYERDESSCPKWFRLFATLDNRADPDVAAVGCSQGCGPGEDTSFNFGVSSTNVSVGKLTAEEETPESGTLIGASPSPSPSPSSSPLPLPSPSGEPLVCDSYYGCQSGNCVFFGGKKPSCAPNFCESDCQGLCGTAEDPENDCL